MTTFTKTALLAAAAALISQGAQAAFVADDLYLGFTGNGAANDYVINLGLATGPVGVNSTPTAPVDLSSLIDITTFNTTFASGPVGVNLSVVGGANPAIQKEIYATLLRTGGAGDWTMAGSISPNQASSGIAGAGVSRLTGMTTPAAGTGTTMPASQTSPTTSYSVAVLGGASSFASGTGVNPASPIGTSRIIYEDLWYAANSTTYNYQYKGYFTLDLSGTSPSMTFTPAGLVAVPEPATYGALAGAGLLVLSLRSQFRRKQA